MTLVIPEGFGQAAYRFSLSGDPEEMVSTIGVDLGFGVQTPQELADKLADDFMAVFGAGNIVAGWTFNGVTIYGRTSPGPVVIFEAPRVRVGTATPTSPPQNVAMLVRKSTNLGGRSGRGRMFLPPFMLSEDSVSPAGMIDAGVRNVLQGLIDNAFLGDGYVILHDSLTPGPPPPTPIVNLTLDPLVATQRRRLR